MARIWDSLQQLMQQGSPQNPEAPVSSILTLVGR